MPKKLHKEIPIDYAVCQQQDCLPAAHRTTGNRITAAEPHPLYPGWGLPLLPRLRSRHLRTGFHRNAEPDVPGAIPAIHVDTHVPFRT